MNQQQENPRGCAPERGSTAPEAPPPSVPTQRGQLWHANVFSACGAQQKMPTDKPQEFVQIEQDSAVEDVFRAIAGKINAVTRCSVVNTWIRTCPPRCICPDCKHRNTMNGTGPSFARCTFETCEYCSGCERSVREALDKQLKSANRTLMQMMIFSDEDESSHDVGEIPEEKQQMRVKSSSQKRRDRRIQLRQGLKGSQ